MSWLDISSSPVVRSPFGELTAKASVGHSLTISDRDGLGIAMLLPRKAMSDALVQRIKQHFNIDLPLESRRVVAGNISIAAIGPCKWLAICENGGNAFTISLRQKFGDVACVSDQSDGYAIARISGLRATELLSKFVPIDLHPRAFKIGAVAATVAAHIGIMLWRLPDAAGAPAFEIVVYRSFADSLSSRLRQALAQL